MITKNRLEELIKEGATIYRIKHCGGDVAEVHLKNISDEFWYVLLGMTEELFENKAEAEEKSKKIKWALKYHATRTEELDLPTWEEFKDYNESICVSFVGEDWGIYELSHGKNRIYLCENDDVWLDWDFNEENYIKACDLCLKLFEGEE